MYDLIVIGGGPAGLAAASAAWEQGLRKILLTERDVELGGILNQCIHNGFGLHYFKEELTGPEYAARFAEKLRETGVEVRLDTMVLDLKGEPGRREVHMVSRDKGYCIKEARSVILAMGCRERTRGAISIPGTRPAGVFTAGAAQRYVNMEGWLPGERIVILGSGDIGLIMARRLTLEGAKVLACVELMPYSGGLTRNIVQCLQDYNIPLYLSHTVTEIRGKDRVQQVVVSQVDGHRKPIPGTEMVFDCDTLLLSVGLIPENELSRQAGAAMDPRTNGPRVAENMESVSLSGVFACGNVAHVHDLVDFVTEESLRAGAAAAHYVQSKGWEAADTEVPVLPVQPGPGVSYVLPQAVRPAEMDKTCTLSFRVSQVFGPCKIIMKAGETQIASFPRERLAPGEMERIPLPKVLLERAQAQSVSVSVEEVSSK